MPIPKSDVEIIGYCIESEFLIIFFEEEEDFCGVATLNSFSHYLVACFLSTAIYFNEMPHAVSESVTGKYVTGNSAVIIFQSAACL
jgi:hypothetical protein